MSIFYNMFVLKKQASQNTYTSLYHSYHIPAIQYIVNLETLKMPFKRYNKAYTNIT